jgi:hypothetical protein
MGADFSNHWFFVGSADTIGARHAAVDHLRISMKQAGYLEVERECDAERSLVVGPGERWIFIGDSAGSTEFADPEGFETLSLDLSKIGPVIDVHMSDSAAVHFYLYREGREVDKFGNAAFPFYRFASEADAAPYRGKPELWQDLLVFPETVVDLRSSWVQEWQASKTLATTADLFGWNTELLWVGYSFDDEGVFRKYDEFLRYSKVELSAFSEYHFKQMTP